MFHDKKNNIEIRYHFIEDMVHKGVVKLKYVPAEKQLADVLTKPLSCVKFEYFQDNVGIVQKDLSQERE